MERRPDTGDADSLRERLERVWKNGSTGIAMDAELLAPEELSRLLKLKSESR